MHLFGGVTPPTPPHTPEATPLLAAGTGGLQRERKREKKVEIKKLEREDRRGEKEREWNDGKR